MPLSWGAYEWTTWADEPALCYGLLAESAMAVAAIGVSAAEPRGSPVFGAGSFDRFFRDALRNDSKTDNFFEGTAGSLYTPLFLSAAGLLTAGSVAGESAYNDTLTRALPLLWVAVEGNSLGTQVAKKSFGRERPYLKFGNQRGLDAFGRGDDSTESFYSGHASTAFLSAAFMDPVVADAVRSAEPAYSLSRASPWSLWLLRLGQGVAFYGLATAVAYSRIEIDLHFMTDVLAGAAIGTLHGQLLYHWSYRRDPEGLQPLASAIPGAYGLRLSWSF
jgi:membrane-associated phospholipid phosphatase